MRQYESASFALVYTTATKIPLEKCETTQHTNWTTLILCIVIVSSKTVLEKDYEEGVMKDVLTFFHNENSFPRLHS